MNWKQAYEKMRDIASEAISLADSYAGGDSENATALNEQFEQLEGEIADNPPKK